MGLFGALNSSLSGLRVTQAQIEVVSSNIANKDSVGYTRRSLNIVQQLTGTATSGARVAGIERRLDVLVQKQLRLETAGAAYTDTRARYAQQLDRLFGTPGSPGSLDGNVNNFTSSLQSLATNPSDAAARGQVLSNAQALASNLNSLSDDIQLLRQQAESQIASGIRRANDALARIADADSKIVNNGPLNNTTAALEDERDRAISDLAALIDIRVVEQQDGKVSLFTTSGLQLYAGNPSNLSFDERAPINANSLFTSNPVTRGVGSIRINGVGGAGIDVIDSNLFRSGEIAAQIDLRDRVLVEAQAQIDDLAAALASSLGDRNPTTSVTTGANQGFDVALDDILAPGTLAIKAGNTLTVEVNTPTGPRRIQLIATDGAAPNPIPTELGEGGATIVRFDRAGGFAGLQGAIAGALGGGFNVTLQPGNVLRVLDAGGGNAVTNVRASFSTSGLTGEGPELPLFVDAANSNSLYTGSLDNLNPEKRGFAGRIGINANVLADNSRLVVFNTTPGSVTPQGDSTRPRLLLERLTSASRGFSAASGIGGSATGLSTSVANFARRVVEDQGAKSANAINTDEGQKIVLRSIEARFSETSGTSIDQELSDLVQIQNAYAANARVVSAVAELFNTLLRIGT
ncbi:MAG: flagellar hook-associated protein FlgK [Beijerinckiaceae bacterium]